VLEEVGIAGPVALFELDVLVLDDVLLP